MSVSYMVEVIGGLTVAGPLGLLAWLRPKARLARQRAVERQSATAVKRSARLGRVGEDARRQASAEYEENLHRHGRKRVVATTRPRWDVTRARWSDGSETFHFDDLQRSQKAMRAREVPPSRTFCCRRPRIGDVAR